MWSALRQLGACLCPDPCGPGLSCCWRPEQGVSEGTDLMALGENQHLAWQMDSRNATRGYWGLISPRKLSGATSITQGRCQDHPPPRALPTPSCPSDTAGSPGGGGAGSQVSVPLKTARSEGSVKPVKLKGVKGSDRIGLGFLCYLDSPSHGRAPRVRLCQLLATGQSWGWGRPVTSAHTQRRPAPPAHLKERFLRQ